MNENTTSYYSSINYISVAIGLIVMVGFIWDSHSVTVSVLAGVGVYGGMATLLIVTPHAKDIAIAHMKEVTIRQNNLHPYEMQEKQLTAHVIDPVRIPSPQPVAPVRLPDSTSYVPAVPRTQPTVKLDAANYINQLFDSNTGQPIPTKITPNVGQIQHPNPSQEAIDYLMALDIVRRGKGKQLYYNRDTYTGCPTLREAINRINSGVKAPSYPGGEAREEEGEP
jgi:hypothetical protein